MVDGASVQASALRTWRRWSDVGRHGRGPGGATGAARVPWGAPGRRRALGAGPGRGARRAGRRPRARHPGPSRRRGRRPCPRGAARVGRRLVRGHRPPRLRGGGPRVVAVLPARCRPRPACSLRPGGRGRRGAGGAGQRLRAWRRPRCVAVLARRETGDEALADGPRLVGLPGPAGLHLGDGVRRGDAPAVGRGGLPGPAGRGAGGAAAALGLAGRADPSTRRRLLAVPALSRRGGAAASASGANASAGSPRWRPRCSAPARISDGSGGATATPWPRSASRQCRPPRAISPTRSSRWPTTRRSSSTAGTWAKPSTCLGRCWPSRLTVVALRRFPPPTARSAGAVVARRAQRGQPRRVRALRAVRLPAGHGRRHPVPRRPCRAGRLRPWPPRAWPATPCWHSRTSTPRRGNLRRERGTGRSDLGAAARDRRRVAARRGRHGGQPGRAAHHGVRGPAAHDSRLRHPHRAVQPLPRPVHAGLGVVGRRGPAHHGLGHVGGRATRWPRGSDACTASASSRSPRWPSSSSSSAAFWRVPCRSAAPAAWSRSSPPAVCGSSSPSTAARSRHARTTGACP